MLALIEDIARGVEEGEAGLKSSGVADSDYVCGISRSNALAMHRDSAAIADEDECFNAMGDLLSKGFSFEEIQRRVHLDGGATRLLAPERWCDLVRLQCSNPGEETPVFGASLAWRSTSHHERRLRARRALDFLRGSFGEAHHASILHVVYGWPDPFINTLPPEARAALGREYAPLARYTNIVEAKRQAMIKVEALERTTDSRPVDLARHRARLERADRCTSSGDALRLALAPVRARFANEEKDVYHEHVTQPHKRALEAFVTHVRIEANRMLSDASRAFLFAWNRC